MPEQRLARREGLHPSDAEMVFQQQCKKDKKPDKSGTGGAAKGKDGGLWKDSSFAELLDATSRRMGAKPLSVIDDVWNTAKRVGAVMEDERIRRELMSAGPRPGSARPGSARPGSARPGSARLPPDQQRGPERELEKDHFMKDKGEKRGDRGKK